MRKISFIVLCIVFMSVLNAQEKVHWVSFEKAIDLNKKTPRPILIDIYTDWCGYCKIMDRDTYANTIIADYINAHYYAVKFDGEGKDSITYKDQIFKYKAEGRSGYHELSALLMDGKLSYPTTIFMSEEEQLLNRMPGYIDAKRMEMVLAYFSKKDRKAEEWDAFSANFKSNITD